jgi:hypothetical protein
MPYRTRDHRLLPMGGHTSSLGTMATASAATMVLPVHRLTPYLRVRIRTDDRSLAIEHRRGLLGLVPLWVNRIEIPLTELGSGKVEKHIRWQCLATAVAIAASVLLLDLPMAVRVALGIVGLLELLLAFGPGEAVHVERTDGRSWTIPFCRAHDFDAALAMEDARRRRDALAGGGAGRT